MRGKGYRRGSADPVLGITPAYAGKRFQHFEFDGCSEDHPRLCGEKCFRKFPSITTTGSPPPMRGKEQEDTRKNQRFRITPAYAGKSFFDFGSDRFNWDHPRLCGEKYSLNGSFKM